MIGFKVASSTDERYGESRFTKNQIRAFAWLLAVVAALAGAAIEAKIMLGDGGGRNYERVPVERRVNR